MSVSPEKTQKNYTLRAKLPQYARIGAIGAMCLVVLALVVGFYRERARPQFKLKPEHANLSMDVVAEVNGYERLESEEGVPKYFIKADYAKTFSDNHQELQNVYLETYDAEGNAGDKMTAARALYVPEADKNFTAYLNGDVNIETRDALKVKTNNVIYSRAAETAEADEVVEFERGTMRGRSLGATVRIAGRTVELLKDVEIEAFESPELMRSGVRYAKVTADYATFNQAENQIELRDAVAIDTLSAAKEGTRTTALRAARAVVGLDGTEPKTSKFRTVELFDDVHVTSAEQGGAATQIDAGHASYDKPADRFELSGGLRIVTDANGAPVTAAASTGVFEPSAHKLALTGNAEITQNGDLVKGDAVYAELFDDNKLRSAVVRGAALARRSAPERTTTVSGGELNISYNDQRVLQDANAVGSAKVEVVPSAGQEYSSLVLSAAVGVGVTFRGDGLLDKLRTDGRTTLQLDAPAGKADAANKRVTADVISTEFAANGKELSRAEAVGNAQLVVEPLKPSEANYQTTVDAPRFKCDFYAGNNVRSCNAGRKVKTVRVPTVRTDRHGTQTLLSDQLTATFNEQSRDLDLLSAEGNARFSELDRTAIASTMTYTQADATVRLRGGEPTSWDSASRVRAQEVDWDTRNRRSYFRGGISTTFYNRQKMGDAAPFASSDKPVFVTSENAEMDHAAQIGVFTGNARGWQDDNYVRADKITIRQREGAMSAEGSVQSALYNAKLKTSSKSAPVFAAARALTYERDARVLRYRGVVDVRQDTDRVTADAVDVYLDEQNGLSRTIAQTNVVITQPGRRATGDWAQYTADVDTAVLRGGPATVTDADRGSTQSSEITFNMSGQRVTSQGRGKPGGGRNRSVYKVRTGQ